MFVLLLSLTFQFQARSAENFSSLMHNIHWNLSNLQKYQNQSLGSLVATNQLNESFDHALRNITDNQWEEIWNRFCEEYKDEKWLTTDRIFKVVEKNSRVLPSINTLRNFFGRESWIQMNPLRKSIFGIDSLTTEEIIDPSPKELLYYNLTLKATYKYLIRNQEMQKSIKDDAKNIPLSWGGKILAGIGGTITAVIGVIALPPSLLVQVGYNLVKEGKIWPEQRGGGGCENAGMGIADAIMSPMGIPVICFLGSGCAWEHISRNPNFRSVLTLPKLEIEQSNLRQLQNMLLPDSE